MLSSAKCLDGDPLQFQGPLQSTHERLGAAGQLFKSHAQRAQDLMNFGVVRRRLGQQRQESIEQFDNVVESGGLELTRPMQVFLEARQGILGRFARLAQMIEPAVAVKLLDRGRLDLIGRIVEVAPGAELLQGGVDLSFVRAGSSARQGLRDFARPKGDDELSPSRDENLEDRAVQSAFVRAKVLKDRITTARIRHAGLDRSSRLVPAARLKFGGFLDGDLDLMPGAFAGPVRPLVAGDFAAVEARCGACKSD